MEVFCLCLSYGSISFRRTNSKKLRPAKTYHQWHIYAAAFSEVVKKFALVWDSSFARQAAKIFYAMFLPPINRIILLLALLILTPCFNHFACFRFIMVGFGGYSSFCMIQGI